MKTPTPSHKWSFLNEAWRIRELSNRAKAVLFVLVSKDGPKGCFPSLQTIADSMGANEKTVRRAVAELKKAGLIDYRRGGTGTSNHYEISYGRLIGTSWTMESNKTGDHTSWTRVSSQKSGDYLDNGVRPDRTGVSGGTGQACPPNRKSKRKANAPRATASESDPIINAFGAAFHQTFGYARTLHPSDGGTARDWAERGLVAHEVQEAVQPALDKLSARGDPPVTMRAATWRVDQFLESRGAAAPTKKFCECEQARRKRWRAQRDKARREGRDAPLFDTFEGGPCQCPEVCRR